MRSIRFWKWTVEIIRWGQVAVGGALLVLILWSQFILAESPWSYLYLFAWLELLDILRDGIRYWKGIPDKRGVTLTRERFLSRTASNLLGAVLSASVARSASRRLG